MNCTRIFIKKEFRELISSKRLLLSLAIGCFSCVIMNAISMMPGSHTLFSLDLERVLLCVNYFVFYLSSDIIFVTMVEEVSSGTFDMIRMSNCSKLKVISLKCLFPMLISIVFFAINIATNNIFALIIPSLLMLDFLNITYWRIAVLSAFGCNLIEFNRCISSKKIIPTDNNYVSFIVAAIYAVLFYVSWYFWLPAIFVAVFVTVCIFGLTLLQMKKIHIVGCKKYIGGRSIIRIRDGNFIKAIMTRELSRFLWLKKDIFKIVYYIISATLVYVVMPQGFYRDIVLCMLIYLFALIFSGSVFLESIKDELYEKMNEILMLANIDKCLNYKIAMFFSLMAGVLIGGLYFIINGFLTVVGVIDTFELKYCIFYNFMLFSSTIFSFMIANKYFVSIKDVKLVKKYLHAISIILYAIMFVLIN